MLEKLDEFLFDILGLIVPGFIFIILFAYFPLVVLYKDYTDGYIFQTYDFSPFINNLNLPMYIVVALLLLVCYIVGHLLKVFSKLLYKLGGTIFDDFFIKLIKNIKLLNTLTAKVTGVCKDKNTFKVWYIFIYIIQLIFDILKDVFTFKSNQYNKTEFETMKKQSEKILLKDFGMQYFENGCEWYPFYKIAKTIALERNVKSNAKQFLAKYNFHRSTAFIFLLHAILITCTYNLWDKSAIIIRYFNIVIAFDIFAWFTFHTKYKRYWELCGNEAIISLYYALHKKDTAEKAT